MNRQKLLLEQGLLTREFVELGKPNGKYVRLEDLEEMNEERFIDPTKFGIPNLVRTNNSYVWHGDWLSLVYYYLGCVLFLDKKYFPVKKRFNTVTSGFMVYPLRVKIATENPDNLEQCSEFLRGLGYQEVNQGGTER